MRLTVRAGADDFTEVIKQLNPRTPVVILSDSTAVTDKVRALADAMVLKAQAQLLPEKLDSLIRIRSHSHPQLDGKYVVFSNSARHYLDCSDGVCELLGYTRMELTSMTIDDASYRPQRTGGIFEQYVQNGKLEGQYILRHKSGKPIFIEYRSEIFPDRCMAAVWEPVQDWKQLYQSAILEFDRSKLRDRIEQHSTRWNTECGNSGKARRRLPNISNYAMRFPGSEYWHGTLLRHRFHALCPAHCITPKYAVQGPTASRY